MIKRVLMLLLLTVCLSSAQASVGQVMDSVVKKSKELADTSIVKAKEAVKFADTSSNFKNIYSDVKAGLIGIDTGLKVGVEHVYKVLVMQQVVKAVQWIILGLLPTILLIVFGKSVWRWGDRIAEETDGFSAFVAGVFYVMCFTGLLLFVFHIDVIATGIINPEYGAIEDIVSFVEKAKQ